MRKFISFLTALSFFSCQKKIQSLVLNDGNNEFTLQHDFDKNLKKCNDPFSYLPDTLHPDHFYTRQLRINFHIVDDSIGGNNFPDGDAQTYLYYMLSDANRRLGEKVKMNLPENNTTPAYDPHLRWMLVPSADQMEKNGYYFDVDNSVDAFFINHGKGQNNYRTQITDRHLVDADTVLNVFIMAFPPDSLLSKTFKATESGIALGNAVKLGGLYQKKKEFWYHSSLLNHEIGHVLTLGHSWVQDGCDDTPINPNCYNQNGIAPCDGLVSNNMMDYNVSQAAITPCQIGKMQMIIARENSRQRKFVVPDWCRNDTSHVIVISDDIEWLGARDLSNSIVIKDGGSLKLCCRVSMPEASSIIVEPGGKLILEDVKLHNACGQKWNGILVQKKGKKKALVEKYGNVEILDVISPAIN